MEADCHDAISGQERFFHTISMVHIYVDIQHPLMILQQLQNGQDYVVDVAEA